MDRNTSSTALRLNKILARSGICSRRRADELIRDGKVSLNGAVITNPGQRATPGKDLICVDGVALTSQRKIYILLHKPAGYTTTVRDVHAEKTVLDLIPPLNVRLFPVGRLDKNTSGLLLLTNDGDFSYRLTHPKFEIEREYQVRVRGCVSPATRRRMEHGGIALGDFSSAPCVITRCVAGKNFTDLILIIREGRNREVRRICSAVHHPVITLSRVRFGRLRLGNLPPGGWIYLQPRDIQNACAPP